MKRDHWQTATTHCQGGIVKIAPLRLVANLAKQCWRLEFDTVVDDIGVGGRAPYNDLVSIPRAPFCNKAGDTTGLKKDSTYLRLRLCILATDERCQTGNLQ